MKEVSRLDAPAAANLMFAPPPTRMVDNVPTAEESAMVVLLVVMILGLGVKFLGIAVLTDEVRIDVRIGVLMGVWVVVAGRKILVPLGRGMRRCCCWLTSPGALTIMVELAGRKSLMGEGVPDTVMPGELS